MDTTDGILKDWSERKNLTKDEHKMLKMVETYGHKVLESILNRQNDTCHKTFKNSMNSAYVDLFDKFAADMHTRKLSTQLDDCYEKNKDYYRLVELMMDKNCCNCTQCGKDCLIYYELEKHYVPDSASAGMGQLDNCRYAYREIKKGDK